MSAPTRSRILLCADSAAPVDDIRLPLERLGHPVGTYAVSAAEPGDLSAYQLVILDGTANPAEALQFCRRLPGRSGDAFLPVPADW